MRVLVTFAVDAEFAPWRKLRNYRSIEYQGLQLWRNDLDDVELTVMITGVGLGAAALAMDLMMRKADQDQYFDICISSGLAGALHESLKPGDIIAPRGLVAEQKRAEARSDRLEVDAELRERALSQGAKGSDCLYSTDQVLVKASQKRECASRAQSVDMESFEIVKEACAWGARSVVIRAISDSASEDLPINFNLTMSEQNQVSIPKVLGQLAKNPFALPALIRFGKQSERAARSLANFLDDYVKGLTGLPRVNISNEVAAR
jgi:adenosylhomocysteine nucleosidase